MNNKRKWIYGMVTTAIIAFAATLNIGKISIVNASNQVKGAKTTNVVLGGTKSKDTASTWTDKSTVTKLPSENDKVVNKPQIEVPVNLDIEKADQKNADSGSSPWKLDPVFVSQVFVSLKISPNGIQGDYPVKYENLKLVESNEKEAVVEVGEDKTPIAKVYLKRLVKQDKTGIWTVVGYDPANNK